MPTRGVSSTVFKEGDQKPRHSPDRSRRNGGNLDDHGRGMMKKLSLEALHVDSFATSSAIEPARGTVQAHAVSGLTCQLLTRDTCPTQYCTPPTAFAGDA
jgi:hypothetical protein